MWDAPRSVLRTYGTFKCRLSLADTDWKSSSEPHVGQYISSPCFTLCGYLWKLRLYPRFLEGRVGVLAMYLRCIGSPPEERVHFQLLLHNQDVEQKTVLNSLEVSGMGMARGRGSPELISLDTLLDVERGFLKNQELSVGVHISTVAADHSRQSAASYSPSLSDVFGSYFDDVSTSDITVRAGEVGTKENTEQEVQMGQIEGPVLKALISFMYGHKDFRVDLLLPLFVAADAHQVEGLRWFCLQNLICRVSTDTVLEYAVVAEAVTDPTLMDACMKFIAEPRNRVEIAQQPAMQRLMQDHSELAQKLLAGVVKQMTSKRKADEMA